MRLDNKVAIVTGASSDIGKGIAKRFVEEGAKVVLVARNLERLEATRKEINCEESTASVSCDVTDESQVQQTVDRIMDAYGKIDILVNNAGAINDPVHFHQMQDTEIKKLIDRDKHDRRISNDKDCSRKDVRCQIRCNSQYRFNLK